MKRKFSIGRSLLASTLMTATQAEGDSTTLGIYPPIIKITAQPQAEVSVPLTLINKSKNEKLLDIDMLAFRSSGNSQGFLEYYTQTNTPHGTSSLLKTIKIFDGENQIKSIKIYPNEYKSIIITFVVPDKQSVDYYFSPVFTEASQSTEKSSTTINTLQSIGSHILVSVSPLQSPTTYISEMHTHPIIFNGPVKISLEAENPSPNFATIQGKISIYNLAGKKVHEENIPSSVILSKSAKNIQTNGKNIEIQGKFIGLYTAKTELTVNESEKLSKDTHFLYIPLFIVVIITILLFIVCGVGYKVIKKLNFKQ